jgi:hypothetical protein
MLTLIKFIRSFFQALAGEARPWQVGLGTFLGSILGLVPIFTYDYGLNYLGAFALGVAIIANVHLGSVLLFSGLGTLLWALCIPLAEAIGGSMDGIAQSAATNPLLYGIGASHTGELGMLVIAAIWAPLTAIVMVLITNWFRSKILPKLLERKKLILTGKIASNGILLRIVCWFFAV